MIQTVLKSFPYVWLTCIGLLIFFGVFLGVLFWAYQKRNQTLYQQLSQLPLKD